MGVSYFLLAESKAQKIVLIIFSTQTGSSHPVGLIIAWPQALFDCAADLIPEVHVRLILVFAVLKFHTLRVGVHR